MSNKIIITTFENLINLKKKELNNAKNNNDKKLITELNFKIRNFYNVIKILKNYTEEITSSKQLENIKGIGKGTLNRIDEIIETDTLKELKDFSFEMKSNQLKVEILKSITGVGEVKANELIKKNINIELLLKEYETFKDNIDDSEVLKNLTHHQIIGLKYYYDLKLLIPRSEIEKIEKRIKKWVKLVDSDLEMIICGSYRRGKDKCGDIDILLLHKNYKTKEDVDKINYLKTVVKYLQNKNILVDNLTESGNTKYMGICKLVSRSKGRRIDIRFIPYNCKASALLYFTGSGHFNENMRADAKKKGYMINEYGLYKFNKKGDSKLIKTETEEDIFKELDMEYKLPKDRF